MVIAILFASYSSSPRSPLPPPPPAHADCFRKTVVFDSVPRVIECYADRFAVVGGRRYMIGHPCDWAVSICVPTEEGKVEAVPLGSELMEELVPGLQVGFAVGQWRRYLVGGVCVLSPACRWVSSSASGSVILSGVYLSCPLLADGFRRRSVEALSCRGVLFVLA